MSSASVFFGLLLPAAFTIAQVPPDIADPAHDAKSGGPDIVSINALASGGILTLRARFDAANFDAKTTRIAWIFDTDQNPATGSPGLLGAPGVGNYGNPGPIDSQHIGAEAVAVSAGTCGMGSLIGYESQTNGWRLLQALPVFPVSNGFDAWLALDSFGKTADNINFKALAYKFSGECPPKSISLDVKDMAPNADQPAAVSRAATSNLAAPQPLTPADGATFNIFPRKTVLVWSAVPNATAYLAEVQHEDPTAATGWSPSVFRRVAETTLDFSFVGAQQGRWRVWALDENGLASPSIPWVRFVHKR